MKIRVASIVGLLLAVALIPSSSLADAVDLSGCTIVQEGAFHDYVIPEGTVIESEGYVIIARNCTKGEFEAFWETLAPGVVFLNSENSVPQINGDEYFTLNDPAGAPIDGPTIAMGAEAGESVQRNNPCDPAGDEESWTRYDSETATPGSGAGMLSGAGVVINEFSDAVGSGNYIYEFVEIFNDDGAPGVAVMSWGVLKSSLR